MTNEITKVVFRSEPDLAFVKAHRIITAEAQTRKKLDADVMGCEGAGVFVVAAATVGKGKNIHDEAQRRAIADTMKELKAAFPNATFGPYPEIEDTTQPSVPEQPSAPEGPSDEPETP